MLFKSSGKHLWEYILPHASPVDVTTFLSINMLSGFITSEGVLWIVERRDGDVLSAFSPQHGVTSTGKIFVLLDKVVVRCEDDDVSRQYQEITHRVSPSTVEYALGSSLACYTGVREVLAEIGELDNA